MIDGGGDGGCRLAGGGQHKGLGNFFSPPDFEGTERGEVFLDPCLGISGDPFRWVSADLSWDLLLCIPGDPQERDPERGPRGPSPRPVPFHPRLAGCG